MILSTVDFVPGTSCYISIVYRGFLGFSASISDCPSKMINVSELPERERHRFRERIRQSSMTAEQRATQNERCRLQYKRRMESINSEKLAAEKKRLPEQYLRRWYGIHSDGVYQNKKLENISVSSGMLQQGVNPAAEWIATNIIDKSKSYQTLDVTYNQILDMSTSGANEVANFNPNGKTGKNGSQKMLDVNDDKIAEQSTSTKHGKEYDN